MNIKLIFIKELIQEAYKLETNKTPLLIINNNIIKYIMINLWCISIKERLLLLQIICKLISMYPNRIENITKNLLCDFSFFQNGTDEFYTLYSVINDLLHLRAKYENQPGWDKYYKKI